MTLKLFESSMQSDVDALFAECFRALGRKYDPEGGHNDIMNIPEVYQKNGQFWCLYDNETLVGTVAIRSLDPVKCIAELKRLYVLPTRQGEGLGGKLFDTALQFAKEAGFKIIRADTRRDRSASRHLMIKNGFKEIPQYNDNDTAELFYEKTY